MKLTPTHCHCVFFTQHYYYTMISQKSTVILKSSPRRTRTKIRKPKFLSLRLQLNSPENTPPPPPMTTSDHHDQKPLINLFPLHPENLVEKQEEEHATMACIFSSCDDDGAATTLTGILSSDEEIDGGDTMNNPSPSSVNYADELVRTAMRKRETERDDHQEKWISSSSSCNDHKGDEFYQFRSERRAKLVLKLDYEKIMKSWVNKGPLYIHTNSDLDFGMDSSQPQTVPDLQDDDFFRPVLIGHEGRENNNSNGALWTVPEMVLAGNNEMCKIHDGGAKEEEAATVCADVAMHQREESVRRYKEKRRNRLFAKTIRYQVRKLNAEKRPRIKGRFVKRN